MHDSSHCHHLWQLLQVFQHLQVRTGQWRRIAGGRVPTQMPPSKNSGWSKRPLTPRFKPLMLLAGPGHHIFFHRRVFVYALAFLVVFLFLFFVNALFPLFKKTNRDERSRALIQTRLAEPVSSKAEPRLNPKLSTNQTLSWAEQPSRWFPTPKSSLSHEPKLTESRAVGRAESSGVRSRA